MILITFIVVFIFGIVFSAMGNSINMGIQFSVIYAAAIFAMYCYEIIDKLNDLLKKTNK